MPKARKVATPGSQASILSPRGWPKKAKSNHGTSRKDNYHMKYTEAMFLEAMECIKEKRMSVREAAKQYGVPKTTLLDSQQKRGKAGAIHRAQPGGRRMHHGEAPSTRAVGFSPE
jgi:hypothetical protein